MSLLNRKMLLAPILAVALVLSLAAAVSYLPAGPQASTQMQPSPEPTPAQNFIPTTPATPSPTGSYYYVGTPAPTTAATATPFAGLATHNSLLPSATHSRWCSCSNPWCCCCVAFLLRKKPQKRTWRNPAKMKKHGLTPPFAQTFRVPNEIYSKGMYRTCCLLTF